MTTFLVSNCAPNDKETKGFEVLQFTEINQVVSLTHTIKLGGGPFSGEEITGLVENPYGHAVRLEDMDGNMHYYRVYSSNGFIHFASYLEN